VFRGFVKLNPYFKVLIKISLFAVTKFSRSLDERNREYLVVLLLMW